MVTLNYRGRYRIWWQLACLVCCFLGTMTFSRVTSGAAETRIALVIGNSAYLHTPNLRNPKNDALDLSQTLRELGFTVLEGLDLTKAQMDSKIRDFAERLVGADVGLFFYAGHGLQVNGQNFLVPVDAKLTTAAALDFEMVRLDLVQRVMERETRTNVIFLDACRDNPLARNLARAMGTRSVEIGRGLAATESGVGTLISFSTQPGNVALDGEGRNSPFAGALMRRIRSAGEDVSSILIRVRNDVMAATHNRQVPWEHSALRARLFFSEPSSTPEIAAPGNGQTLAARTDQHGAPTFNSPTRKAGVFDGAWEVSLRGSELCALRTNVFRIGIYESAIYTAKPKSGKVKADGAFEFSAPSRIRPDLMTLFSGKLTSESGSGAYKVLGGRCSGTVTLRRLQDTNVPMGQ